MDLHLPSRRWRAGAAAARVRSTPAVGAAQGTADHGYVPTQRRGCTRDRRHAKVQEVRGSPHVDLVGNYSLPEARVDIHTRAFLFL